ncbi:carbamoyl-phosphate synthase [Rhodoferax aquaticus]|uniref:Carbamoyl-phosphate synthase n=1 Tax=Rhodoferax aquaticus TaxID=2527691 RepID=A0A515EP71_9BURK|nr:carbamoyl-phosphate synthase [Rhodoferax aquaticus]QDL54458.1 carbamoyl-phosphate synthase [Rhodoferax aquaticus]
MPLPQPASDGLAMPTPTLPAQALPPPRGMALKNGGYNGTLAAARDLGRHGIPSVLMEMVADTPTAHSRYVTEKLFPPGLSDLNAYAQWLIQYGKEHPGYVLYPSSDDLCWVMDTHRDELAKYFYLYQPEAGGIYELLNKKRLFLHCQKQNVDHPPTWFPMPGEDMAAFAQKLEYPVLIKPQTQAGLRVHTKGATCYSPEEFLATWTNSETFFSYKPEVMAKDPSVAQLMVQRFYPEAATQIYSLAGFIDPDHDIFLVRASEKLLQQPVTVGVGLCFESRPVFDKPAQQLRRMIAELGYRGAFEVEFIHLKSTDSFLLIDFNSRFYGQMSFEIARNLPIPRLCYYAAVGDLKKLKELAAKSQEWDHTILWKCRVKWMLKLFITTQTLGGNFTWGERRQWLAWARSGNTVDPIYSPDDLGPFYSFRRTALWNMLRYPRSSLRKYFLK